MRRAVCLCEDPCEVMWACEAMWEAMWGNVSQSGEVRSGVRRCGPVWRCEHVLQCEESCEVMWACLVMWCTVGQWDELYEAMWAGRWCESVWQCEEPCEPMWACLAMWGTVWGNVGSHLRQCEPVGRCDALSGDETRWVRRYDYVWRCKGLCVVMWSCVAMWGSVCVDVRESVWRCEGVCVAMWVSEKSDDCLFLFSLSPLGAY